MSSGDGDGMPTSADSLFSDDPELQKLLDGSAVMRRRLVTKTSTQVTTHVEATTTVEIGHHASSEANTLPSECVPNGSVDPDPNNVVGPAAGAIVPRSIVRAGSPVPSRLGDGDCGKEVPNCCGSHQAG